MLRDDAQSEFPTSLSVPRNQLEMDRKVEEIENEIVGAFQNL